MDLKTITDIAAKLPTQPMVSRAGEGEASSFGEGQEMRFPFYDKPEVPGFWVERGVRGPGAPLHRHPWASFEYVIDGTVRFIVGDEELVLNAGDFIYTPPSIPHTYFVESDTAHIFGTNFPGGYFRDLQLKAAPIFTSGGPPDMEKVVRLAAEHGVEVLGPPPQPSA